MMDRKTILIAMSALLILVGGITIYLFSGKSSLSESIARNTGDSDNEILYWVAPMDPNYRRDKPGKSPMGMDLVPVYKKDAQDTQENEPAITINPAVVNNIGVRTAKAVRADIAQRVRTVGRVTVDEEVRAAIHVRTEGWVEKLHVESEGEQVKKGEILFEIYAPALVTAQAEYLQARKMGRAGLIDASREKLISLGMSEAQIAALQQRGNTARLLAVHAPQDGVITELKLREGIFVRPADMAMQIADLSRVWVIADVFDSDAPLVEQDQTANMTLPAFPGATWQGRVDYIYPTAVSDSRTVPVRLRFDNSDGRLKPNMYAHVVIDAAPADNALTVPAQAIIRSSKGDHVILALGEGRFRPAQVITGFETADRVHIMEGLREGEDVVVSAQFLLDSEASVDAGLMRLASYEGTHMAQMDMSDDKSGMKMDMPKMDMSKKPSSSRDSLYEGVGVIKSIESEKPAVVLDHDPIPALNWPTMVMSFDVSDDVDLSAVSEGDEVTFTFVQTDTGFEVRSLTPASSGAQQDMQDMKPEDMESHQ